MTGNEPDLDLGRDELIALATRVRGQNWARRLAEAVDAARRDHGWTNRRAGNFACDLIYGPLHADPQHLLEACRSTAPDPDHPRYASEQTTFRGADLARERLGLPLRHQEHAATGRLL